MAELSPEQLAYLVHSAGFSKTRRHRGQREDVTAVAIAMCESSGNTNARGDGGQSWGLFQIYQPVWGDTFAHMDLFNPVQNTQAAFEIFSRADNTFRDWSCYSQGLYLTHIPRAARAVQNPIEIGSQGGIGSPVDLGFDNPLGPLNEWLDTLTAENTWIRVGMFLGGATLLVVVFVMLFGDDIANIVPHGRAMKAAKGAKRLGKVGKQIRKRAANG